MVAQSLEPEAHSKMRRYHRTLEEKLHGCNVFVSSGRIIESLIIGIVSGNYSDKVQSTANSPLAQGQLNRKSDVLSECMVHQSSGPFVTQKCSFQMYYPYTGAIEESTK